MNKAILFIIVLVVVFSGVVWFLGRNKGEDVSFPQATPRPTLLILSPTPPAVTPKIVTINMADSGFSPAEVTVNAGDTVRLMNQGTRAMWPASGIHPTHELYPGSSIQKCGTVEANFIFDACRGLNNGESFSFIFNTKGNWPFHDHLNPSIKGKIIVQ